MFFERLEDASVSQDSCFSVTVHEVLGAISKQKVSKVVGMQAWRENGDDFFSDDLATCSLCCVKAEKTFRASDPEI